MGTILACLIYVGDERLEMKMQANCMFPHGHFSTVSPREICLAANTGNGSSDFLKSLTSHYNPLAIVSSGRGSHNCQSILSSCSYTMTGLMTFKG